MLPGIPAVLRCARSFAAVHPAPTGKERPEPKHETTARHLWVDSSRAAGAERPEPNGITPLGIRRSIAVGPLARNGQSFGDSQFR